MARRPVMRAMTTQSLQGVYPGRSSLHTTDNSWEGFDERCSQIIHARHGETVQNLSLWPSVARVSGGHSCSPSRYRTGI